MTRIVVLDDYQQVARRLGDWGRLGPDVDLDVVHEHLTGQVLLDRLRGAEVVVAMRERTPFPASLLDKLGGLRLLVTTGLGNASIDLEAAERQGITVCGTHSSSTSTVELTWALILALVRQVPTEDRALREGGWQQSVGVGLAGRTLGVVGLGRIGSRVAAIGQAFGMRVVAWSQNLDPEAARALQVEPVTREALLAEADVVSLHLRLSPRTRHLVGARELAAMGPSTFLVNTARGGIVDEPALAAALHEGVIAGAGLDVFEAEPLPADAPIRSAPNTVLTPHLGYVSAGTYEIFYREIIEDILAWRSGTPLRVLVPAGGTPG